MAVVLCVGLTTVDVTQQVDEFPEPGEKMQSLAAFTSPGGPAANAATAVAALGHRAVLVTAAGADPLGALALRGLADRRVEVVDTAPEDFRIALSMVVVRAGDGERTVVSRNAGGHLPAVPADLPDRVAEADVLLLDGHLGPLALAAARSARGRGVPVVLDAGSWKPVLDDLLPLVDVAACSAAFPLTERAVHDRGVPLVIRTRGALPVTWSNRTTAGPARPEPGAAGAGTTPAGSAGPDGGPVVSAGEVPVTPVPVRDTNGAGDVWHGALAVALARREPVARAVAWANEVAAVRVRNPAERWVEELWRWRDSG
ncbi:carbohydrate kinase [Actinosynnema pretiosum subsp. pretiosum]|uniref:Carbohydrate kinase n=1 Tax=Actinosynnema pretiosum subsp. pretiosum TaxID=103721 RepID=A0AA45L2I5_9PSEU|nr:carbohydrate kinase [Actinosynnema pretiosum subsp. pretiosum]